MVEKETQTTTRSNDLPRWVRAYLDESDKALVETAVEKVEKNSSAEIVPIVVSQSCTIGHVPQLTFLVLAFLTFLAATFYYPGEVSLLIQGFATLALGLISFGLSKLSFFRRILTTKEDRLHQVAARAQLEFYQHHLNKTEGQTGILIFVSLMEHQAIVLADESIASKVDPKVWDETVNLLLKETKRKNLAGGFIKAIEHCGEIVTPHFPVSTQDTNELCNSLVIKD